MPDFMATAADTPTPNPANTTHTITPRKRPEKLNDEQVAQLEHLIKQQEVTGLTDQALADILKVSTTTIRNHRRRMAAGLRHNERNGFHEARQGPVSLTESAKRREERAGFAPDDPAPPVVNLDDPLTPEGSLRLLSWIARGSANPNAQVAALRAIESLRAQIEAPARVGPPDPLTEEEQVVRVAAIIDAVGVRIVRLAMDRLHPGN
jgi:hypothetical protein